MASPEEENLEAFRARVFLHGEALYRDLPWRNTHDAYEIWISEVMLQQTQVSRVDGRWQHWLELFPTVDALAAASSTDVLSEWQGMGYNRRALLLHNAAQTIVETYHGAMPRKLKELCAIPSIGKATAAGIRAFAYDLPGVYLETNVRTVFLHELMPDAVDVPDSALVPLIEEACPKEMLTITGAAHPCTPRSWYYALLDYGAHLKKTLPNPSRRSRAHTKQSRFEGSHRQKRAAIVRLLLGAQTAGLDIQQATEALNASEIEAGRTPVDETYVLGTLDELTREGFCSEHDGIWRV